MATVIAPERLHTFDEYLEQEINSELRLEYRRGRIFSVTGAKENHIEIVWNLGGLLRVFLKGKPFRGFGCDMRVECTPDEYYTHPDLSIAPSPPDIKPIRGTATLCNPIVIMEVLSPSTEAVDRGEKFIEYTKIASLREYLLVSQNVAQIECWSRGSDGQWVPSVVTGLKAELRIESIECALPMSEIYFQTTVQDDTEESQA
jgi:Uma2 family endonuclease